MTTADRRWDYFLSLDGTTMIVNEELGFWVKIAAHRMPCARAVPHGVRYSLTLHHRSGKRLLGFDNAHHLTGDEAASDHWHRHAADPGRRYLFESPEKLLADFWKQVDRVLKEHEDD